MAKDNKSLFQKLTTLFKSGPVVRKKLRTRDTTVAVADKSKSSGTLLFQKSSSPTYATITANAYNLSERLMRYQDYSEMEYCIHGATRIAQLDGYVTIEELARKCSEDPDHKFVVYAYDHEKKKIVPAWGKQARLTRTDHAWKVTFDSGKEIIGSANHKLMLRDGSYKAIEDLLVGDAMMPFYRKDLFDAHNDKSDGYRWIYTTNPTEGRHGWDREHKIVAEWSINRKLQADEVVHHINFDKSDNRTENLRVMTKSDHSRYHSQFINEKKWLDKDWAQKFGIQHAKQMMSNPPTKRTDVTFSRILIACEENNFNLFEVMRCLDVDINVVKSRLADYGFSNFETFRSAYRQGNLQTSEKIRTLTVNDLNLDKIKCIVREEDTKTSLSIKLGCTMNVLDKFLWRKCGISWLQLREDLGFSLGIHQRGRRPKGSHASPMTYQMLCSAYKHGMSRPQLAKALHVTASTVTSRILEQGYKKFDDFAATYENHKVVSIEYFGEIPLYDLTVDGYKNFATDTVISHNTPELASAMDIYADETVSADEKGRSFHVYSDNERIRELLEDLFYNTLNVEFNLRSWTRNVVKYGDLFLYNDVSPTHGVINAFPIPVNEIEREENYDPNDPMAVRFRWVTLGNRTLENWEISHFRLLGNDMFLPYGSSVIEPARRIWRQLILIEDAMLVYRVVRAPERRVFYIDVANIPPENVPMYVEEQRKNLRSNQVVDRQTGRVDLRYNPLCFQANVIVPLLDGRSVSIKKLTEEWESGKRDHEVYSLDISQGGRMVPGRVIWAGKSGHASKMARVTLDDGGVIEVTPDHKMMRRDGNPVKARDLLTGDSLMPFYNKYALMDDTVSSSISFKGAYEKVFDPASGTNYFTHRLIAAHKYGLRVYGNGFIAQQGHVVHHRDHVKLNNCSENLELMTCSEHSKHHSELAAVNITKYNKSEEKREKTVAFNMLYRKAEKMGSVYNSSSLHKKHNEIRSSAMKNMWLDQKKNTKAKLNMTYKWDDTCQGIVVSKIRQMTSFVGIETFLKVLAEDETFVSHYVSINSHFKRDPRKSIRKTLVGKFITKQYKDWKSVWAANHPSALGRKFTNNVDMTVVGVPNNHKVVSVEIVDIDEEVYNVTVDEYHNLAVQASNCEGTNQGKVQSFQSVDEDYFIPVRGGESGTRIDTLAGGQNTAAVEDVAYIQKKLFAALKIPRAYLGYDEALSSKSTLAQEDIRFSRTINVIQKTMLAELNKLAIIHLFANGFDEEDLQNFTLRLCNPSTVAQQQKLELWRAKFEIAGSAPEGQMSKEFIRKEIWGLNDEQCKNIDEQRLKEKMVDQAIETAESAESGGTTGGEESPPEPGGEEADGGEEEAPEAETGGAEDLFAGDDVSAKEPGLGLLTAGDDPSDDEDFPAKMSLSDTEAPVRAQNQLSRALYNRSRIKHNSASRIHEPDFVKMTSGRSKTMTDPYDKEWADSYLRNPFGESVDRQPAKTMVGNDVMSALRNMSNSAKFKAKGQQEHQATPRVIIEAVDDQADARENDEVLVIDEDDE